MKQTIANTSKTLLENIKEVVSHATEYRLWRGSTGARPALQAVGDMLRLTERHLALSVLVLENADDEAVSIQQVIMPYGDFGLNEKNLNVRAYDINILNDLA